MFNIIIIGAPGCGKGTQSANIIRKYGFTHISTGEILREEVELHTSIGEVVKKFIDRGYLVPDDIITHEIFITATSQPQQTKGMLFDGFPRTIFQADYLDSLLFQNGSKISLVIQMDVDEDELYNRILNRSKDSNRSDDHIEIIHKRLKEYDKKTHPLIEYYRKQGKLQTVRAMDPVKDVFGRIANIIDDYLIKEGK